MVPVMLSTAYRTDPSPDANIPDSRIERTACMAHLAGREVSVSLDDMLSFLIRLICEHTGEHTPSVLGYALSVDLCHFLRVQVLDTDIVICIDKLPGFLVKKVPPLVTDLLVLPRNLLLQPVVAL